MNTYNANGCIVVTIHISIQRCCERGGTQKNIINVKYSSKYSSNVQIITPMIITCF